MVAGMVVCLAYLMSGVVCKPFRFFAVALCVRRVVCSWCLWKRLPRKRLHGGAHPVVRKNWGCVEREERTGESHREKGNVTEVRRVAL